MIGMSRTTYPLTVTQTPSWLPMGQLDTT